MAKEELRNRYFANLPPRLFQEFLHSLVEKGLITVKRERLKLTSQKVTLTPQQEKIRQRLEEAFLVQPFSPPSPAELWVQGDGDEAREVYGALVEEGTLIRLSEDLTFHGRAVALAREKLLNHLQSEGSITVSQFRDLLQTSRRYALPLLEYFDGQRLTKRVGDERVLAKT